MKVCLIFYKTRSFSSISNEIRFGFYYSGRSAFFYVNVTTAISSQAISAFSTSTKKETKTPESHNEIQAFGIYLTNPAFPARIIKKLDYLLINQCNFTFH